MFSGGIRVRRRRPSERRGGVAQARLASRDLPRADAVERGEWFARVRDDPHVEHGRVAGLGRARRAHNGLRQLREVPGLCLTALASSPPSLWPQAAQPGRFYHSFMQVYSPTWEAVPRRMSPVAPVIGIALLVVLFAGAVRFAIAPTTPDFRNFGTVQTRFGTAGVVCGAAVTSGCNQTTGLAFAQCTPALSGYFGSYFSEKVDARVRELLGARPPAGGLWSVTCGRPALIRGAPAQLKSNRPTTSP